MIQKRKNAGNQENYSRQETTIFLLRRIVMDDRKEMNDVIRHISLDILFIILLLRAL